MKLTTSFDSEKKRTDKMAIGDMAIVTYGHLQHVVLRIHRKIVSLTDPDLTWDEGAILNLVRFLIPGESVTLTQE